MNFKEWVDALYETVVDLCDMTEDEVAELYKWYKEEEEK